MADIPRILEGMDKIGFDIWAASRPPKIREAIKKWPPWKLYRMDSGHRGHIITWTEHLDDPHGETQKVTVIMAVTGEFNRVIVNREVFGIDPNTLVECDLPDPNEKLGCAADEAGYTRKDVEEILIPKIREEMKKRGGHNPKCGQKGCYFCDPDAREG